MTKSSTSHTASEVVANGIDSLKRAVNDLAKSPPDTKDAALHLFSAIEVLLKARLIREHWTLAVSKLEGATVARYENGELITVDSKTAIKRLRDVLGVDISTKHEKDLEAVRALRNRVAHFAMVGVAPASMAPDLARGFGFAWWFLGKHIQPGAPKAEVAQIDEAIEDVISAIAGVGNLVTQRMNALDPELGAAAWVLRCPRCQQPALCEGADGPPECKFCFWISPGAEGADEYVEDSLGLYAYVVIKDGGEWPVIECPECFAEALVEGVHVVRASSSRIAGADFRLCFSCGTFEEGSHIERCGRCGFPCGASICENCVDHLMAE